MDFFLENTGTYLHFYNWSQVPISLILFCINGRAETSDRNGGNPRQLQTHCLKTGFWLENNYLWTLLIGRLLQFSKVHLLVSENWLFWFPWDTIWHNQTNYCDYHLKTANGGQKTSLWNNPFTETGQWSRRWFVYPNILNGWLGINSHIWTSSLTEWEIIPKDNGPLPPPQFGIFRVGPFCIQYGAIVNTICIIEGQENMEG